MRLRYLYFLIGILFFVITPSASAFTGSGAGSSGNPYQITTCVQLQEMNDALTSYYKLMNNIDCSDTINWNSGAGFLPIGYDQSTGFRGSLDGQNYTISDLYINRTTSAAYKYVGLIGFLYINATTTNVYLDDVNITGADRTGGAIGFSFGYINNVHVLSGTVVGTQHVGGAIGWLDANTTQYISSGANVEATNANVSGLVGTLGSNDILEYVYSTGHATGTNYVGGLVGRLSTTATLRYGYARGRVHGTGSGASVGGAVGWNESTVTQVYATGLVTVASGSVYGGLIGDNGSTMTGSYWNTETTGRSSAVGSGTAGSNFGRTTAQMSGASAYTNMSNFNWNSVWTTYTGVNDNYPILQFQSITAGAAPTTQATNATSSSVAQETATLSWTNGNGAQRIVFLIAASSGSASPVDGTTYTPNTAFGSGTQIGSSGWYAVYKGVGTSVSLTGLAPGTAYRAHVVELNGASTSVKYLTETATENPTSTTTLTYSAPSTAASNITIGTVVAKSATISWTRGNGSNVVVFMKAGSSGSAAPSNNTTYTASSAFANGTQIGSSGWYTVYKGSGTSVTVSGLISDTAYRVHVVEFNGSTGSETYQTGDGANNPRNRDAYAGTTIYSNYSTGNDTTGAGTSGSPYKTFHKAYTMAIDGDTLNLTGTFSWSNSDETGDSSSSGVGYTLAKSITISGQNAIDTIIQASTTDNTADRRVFSFSSSVAVTIQNVTLRYGKTTFGGCLYVNGLYTVTLRNVDVHSCRATSSDGGGIYAISATTTIENSSIRGNYASSGNGGGVYFSGGSNPFTITNSTITGNTSRTDNASYYGAAVYVTSSARVWLTNTTITANTGYQGAVAGGSGSIYVKNTIIANNTATHATVVDIYRASGTFTSGGNNIVGEYTTTAFATTSTDWSDSDGNGTFILGPNTSTGTLSLGSAAADATYGTYTHALQSGSIGIDQGSATAHTGGGVTVSIPTSDQRGLGRSGTTDIGAYEYNGVGGDTTPPTVSLTLPNDGVSIQGNAIGMTADASDDTAVAGVKFYVNGILVGSEDTSAPYGITWNSLAATTSGIKIVRAVARDTANNYATSTARTVTLSNQPSPQSVSATPSANGASISWTTPVEGTTRVFFGVGTALASSTPEANTGTHVTSHSTSLAGLPSCAVFKYVTVSKTAATEFATSSETTLKTSGCTGGASITANGEQQITVASGGTLTQGNLSLSVPANVTGSAGTVTFQASTLDATTFESSAGTPSGKTRGGEVFHLKAFVDEDSIVEDFDQPIQVTLAYDASEIDESTATIYRYDASVWTSLSSCSVDTSANEVTCQTTGFSEFAVFGNEASSGSSSSGGSSSVGGSSQAWCSGPNAPGWVSGLPGGGCHSSSQYSSSAVVAIATIPEVVSVSPKRESVASTTISVASTSAKYRFSKLLRAGMIDEEVRQLQVFLNTNGFVIAKQGLGAPGNETTVFGPLTWNALVRFQEAHASDILTPLNLKKGTGIFAESTRTFVNAYEGSR